MWDLFLVGWCFNYPPRNVIYIFHIAADCSIFCSATTTDVGVVCKKNFVLKEYPPCYLFINLEMLRDKNFRRCLFLQELFTKTLKSHWFLIRLKIKDFELNSDTKFLISKISFFNLSSYCPLQKTRMCGKLRLTLLACKCVNVKLDHTEAGKVGLGEHPWVPILAPTKIYYCMCKCSGRRWVLNGVDKGLMHAVEHRSILFTWKK